MPLSRPCRNTLAALAVSAAALGSCYPDFHDPIAAGATEFSATGSCGDEITASATLPPSPEFTRDAYSVPGAVTPGMATGEIEPGVPFTLTGHPATIVITGSYWKATNLSPTPNATGSYTVTVEWPSQACDATTTTSSPLSPTTAPTTSIASTTTPVGGTSSSVPPTASTVPPSVSQPPSGATLPPTGNGDSTPVVILGGLVFLGAGIAAVVVAWRRRP